MRRDLGRGQHNWLVKVSLPLLAAKFPSIRMFISFEISLFDVVSILILLFRFLDHIPHGGVRHGLGRGQQKCVVKVSLPL